MVLHASAGSPPFWRASTLTSECTSLWWKGYRPRVRSRSESPKVPSDYVIARQCMVEAAHKGQLKGEVKAIRVPRGRNDKISPQAFSFCTEIRHALVESGVKTVGEAAWRSCRQLQIVHLPDTVVSLLRGAFSWCQIPRVVVAPGCKHFGAAVFEECRSFSRVGTRPRAFQACTALSHINLGMPEPDAAHPNRCLLDCCFGGWHCRTCLADRLQQDFFFHECGRRVGMVPRSSLKEGKYSQMVEKRTKTTQQQKTTANQ